MPRMVRIVGRETTQATHIEDSETGEDISARLASFLVCFRPEDRDPSVELRWLDGQAPAEGQVTHAKLRSIDFASGTEFFTPEEEVHVDVPAVEPYSEPKPSDVDDNF